MGAISFSRITTPIGSWTPSQNPDVQGSSGEEDYLQPTAMSDGGNLYCYDKGIGEQEVLRLSWTRLPLSDFQTLQTFFQAVKKSRYSFTFTDFDGSTRTVRFYSKISWSNNKDGLTLSVNFDLRKD